MQVIENIISPDVCKIVDTAIHQTYQKLKENNPNNKFGDGLVKESFSAYALPETEQMLVSLTPIISRLIGRELYPTYSYCRIYLPGAVMKPHTDRAACEFSMSLCVGGDPWPLWFELDKPTPITINPGSAVLYPGLELTHWRETYQGTGCTQVFLHWVDANGKYADWKYDRRPAIGSAESEKTYWGKS